jgi:hypothetical protein
LKIDAPEELEALMTEEAYTKYIDEETKGSADKGGA